MHRLTAAIYILYQETHGISIEFCLHVFPLRNYIWRNSSVTPLQTIWSFAVMTKKKKNTFSAMGLIWFYYAWLIFPFSFKLLLSHLSIYAEGINNRISPCCDFRCIVIPLSACAALPLDLWVQSFCKWSVTDPPAASSSEDELTGFPPILHVLMWEPDLAQVPAMFTFLCIPRLDMTWCHASERKFNHVHGAHLLPRDKFPS